jgi:hypothetical protein
MEVTMAITDWPNAERPREKLLSRGASALSDAELLALFLRTGVRGRSAVDLARQILLQFNGLRGLLNADQTAFCAIAGLGTAKFSQLQAVLELARRHLAETLQRGDAREKVSVARWPILLPPSFSPTTTPLGWLNPVMPIVNSPIACRRPWSWSMYGYWIISSLVMARVWPSRNGAGSDARQAGISALRMVAGLVTSRRCA